MAGNQNSGQKLAFSIPDAKLDQMIEEYKNKVDQEVIPRASWANFCAYLGYTEKEVAEVVAKGSEDSNTAGAYYKRAIALKRMMTWMRGQLSSGKGWNGQNQARAIFLMKQDHGDGIRYSDQDAKAANGPAKVVINFGGDDPRAKKASK
jgi:hypothetical protein